MNIFRNVIGVLIALAIFNVGFSASAHASNSSWSLDSFYEAINNISLDDAPVQTAVIAQNKPADSKAKAKTVIKAYTVTATAYSSSVDETDSTPFITAANTHVRDGIVATNLINPETGKRYAFGTAIKIPAIYGNKIFVVEDRMNSRYTTRVDIWFPSKQAAKQFGVKTVKIEIVS